MRIGKLLIICAVAVVPAITAAAQDTRDLTRESTKLVAERRTALVIGNTAYQHAPRLANPVNDAHDIAATLRELGFEVLYGEDQNADQMKRLIKDFGVKLKAGGKGLFYYAGHGIQLNGRNYLIPVEVDSLREGTIEFDAVDVNRVLAEMDAAGNGFNIVILDACRNNPFSRSWRDTAGGLASISAPTGTFIAYSTAPNSVASDGTGRNGLYTQELLKQLRTPNLVLEEVFKQVRTEVRKKSNSKQVPWESSSVEGTFYFSGDRNGLPIATQKEIRADKPADETDNKTDGSKPLSSSDGATELAFWDAVKGSTNAADFRAYLKKFPNGTFAELASNRITSLETAQREKDKAAEASRLEDEAAKPLKTFKVDFIEKAGFGISGSMPAKLLVFAAGFRIDLGGANKENEPCEEYKVARIDGVQIREIKRNNGMNYRLKFQSVSEANEGLGEIHRICNPITQVPSTDLSGADSLEGTIWRGASPGGDKQYEFEFLPGGRYRGSATVGKYVFKDTGTWRRVGNTVSIDSVIDGFPNKQYHTEATIDQDTMKGSSPDGKYKFTMRKVR